MTRRENIIATVRHQAATWTPNVYTDIDLVLQSTVNERYEGKAVGKDEFGVSYTYVPEAGAPIVTPGSILLDDITQWEDAIHFPQVELYDWEEGARRDTAGWDRDNKFSAVMLYNGPFERMHAIIGFEEALMALLTEPDAAFGFMHAFAEYRAKLIRHIAKHYKPDAIMLFDDYGTGNAMMMSPDVWRSIIKPHLQKLIDATHECGMYYIAHSCGYIKPIIADFVNMGADIIHPMQYANNVKELKDAYQGRITFTGGFNALEILENPSASEQQKREEVRRGLAELAEGGSYIAWQTILDPAMKRIFLEEVMKDSIPKMRAAGAALPDWESIKF